jgi:hypothetical protein
MEGLPYQIRDANVVHELVDGEVTIIDLVTGVYYALAGSGALIWHCLAQGPCRQEDLSRVLRSSYPVPESEALRHVSRLLKQLRDENLVTQPPSGTELPSPSGTNFPRASAFEPPSLEKFTDMEDLLLADPIHEVESRGWPYTNDGK